MIQQSKTHSRRQRAGTVPPSNDARAESVPSPTAERADSPLERARRQISHGQFQKAIDLLGAAGRDDQVRNARGVCFLRMGRIDEAIRIFHDLALASGCTWVRPDAPIEYKINFATALLLGGHPSGCHEILAALDSEQHPSVLRLRKALQQWSRGLTFWQRLNWRFGRIEPANCQISIDFVPGELENDGHAGNGTAAARMSNVLPGGQ